MLSDLFRDPLAIEALAVILITAGVWFSVRTLRGVAERISRRRALREFVGGVDLYYKGEYEEARDLLGKVIERDPENSEARILLGDACRELGDTAEGHKHHYQVARVFGQDLPRNRLALGKDLLLMGRAEEAVAHLEVAHAAEPDDVATAELYLEATLQAGDMGRAVDLAKRLDNLCSGDGGERIRRLRAAVCVRAGRDYVRRGQTKEGSQLLRTAVRLNPSLVAPRVELVRTSWLHGTARSAEKELEGQLNEMARLAEGGAVVFEPPATAPAPEDVSAAGPAVGLTGGPPALPPGDGAKALAGDGAKALPAPEDDAASLPVVRADRVPMARAPAAGGESAIRTTDIPDAPLSIPAGPLAAKLLPRAAVYVCAHCRRGETVYREECPECGRVGTLVATDVTGLVPVEDIKEVFDEIQENRAFLRTLVRRAAEGDEIAAKRLVAAGPRIVKGVFREMFRVPDNVPLTRVLSRLGPVAVDPILDGYQRARAFSTRKLVREGVRGFRGMEDLLVRVFAGMGEEVLPKLMPLIDTGEKELRVVVLDVLIRLGAAGEIEEMRFVVPPKEILERLTACPEEDLGPFLDACSADGFLAARILVDRTFDAERALVRALARRGNREKLRTVLMQRGFSARTYEALEEVWEEESARLIVRDIVRSYGRSAADHLLKTYTTATVPEEVREEALRLYMDLGGEEIERLVERLSDGDPEAERALMRVVTAFGNRAVPVLVGAYGKTGLLGKVGLNRRRLSRRKATFLRALGRIGTYDATQGLRSLLMKEVDPDLKRRIQGLLERKEAE